MYPIETLFYLENKPLIEKGVQVRQTKLGVKQACIYLYLLMDQPT